MPKKKGEGIEAEDDKRILKTSATVLSDQELDEKLKEMDSVHAERIYAGVKPSEIESSRLGRVIDQIVYVANTDSELHDFMQRAHVEKSILIKIVDKEGETHGIVAAKGEMTLYDGDKGYHVVASMYEDTFLDLILGEIDINYAFAAGYIVFEGANWLLHSEVLRTMFSKFRTAVTGKSVLTLIGKIRKKGD